LTLKLLFGLPCRSVEGLLGSVFHFVVDATGLGIVGQGQWAANILNKMSELGMPNSIALCGCELHFARGRTEFPSCTNAANHRRNGRVEVSRTTGDQRVLR
jgi:hypothetical protein